jgi:hypothetical protein
MRPTIATSKLSPTPRTFGARSLTAAQLARVSGGEEGPTLTTGEEEEVAAGSDIGTHGYIKIKKLNSGG